MRVELLTIGTELLMGFVLNTHASYLGQKLSAIGAALARQVCVNDSPTDILDVLREAVARADLVITTGGLGPTSDDITRNLVVQQLGLKTHVDSRALKMIETRFHRRAIPMPESVKIQAVVPDGATVFYNLHGTAPGLAIPIASSAESQGVRPVKRPLAKWIVMLPGPPRELHPMFESQALPFILEEYASRLPALDCRLLKVAGMGESLVEAKVEPVLKDISNLEIGYCARPSEVDLRLAARDSDRATAQKWADEAERRAREALGDAVFGKGDVTLEEVVVHLLRERKKQVGIAESCTGGFLAHRITLAPGSSEVFRAGWVTYSNEAKTRDLGVPGHLIVEHGAVSEPVARAMAEGAMRRAGADYAIAVTGIAGPDGGTPEKPAGTVFIALASRSRTQVEHHCFAYDRETFKFVAAQTALDMLRKELL